MPLGDLSLLGLEELELETDNLGDEVDPTSNELCLSVISSSLDSYSKEKGFHNKSRCFFWGKQKKNNFGGSDFIAFPPKN